MKKTILLTILIISLALTGCALKKKVEVGNNEQNGNAQNTASENTQMANPASVYCEEQGGKLEIVENDQGQSGICKFSDGSECDEWAFFRKECKAGSKKLEVKSNNEEVIVETGNDKIKVFNISDNQTIYSPLTVSGQAVAFENNLIVELRNSDHETLVKESTKIYNSGQAGEMGDYSINKLNFKFNNTKEGFVAVYEPSAENGSELNLVEIPVKFGNLDISNWQTYQNKEFGFEIKYPKELLYDDSNKEHVTFGTEVMPYISIDIYDNSENLDLKEFISQSLKNIFGSLLDLSSVVWQAITINNLNGLQANFENVAGGYSGKVSWDYVEKEGKVYRIAVYQNLKQWSYVELHDILISTFKFTN